jgi:hypothetical protein
VALAVVENYVGKIIFLLHRVDQFRWSLAQVVLAVQMELVLQVINLNLEVLVLLMVVDMPHQEVLVAVGVQETVAAMVVQVVEHLQQQCQYRAAVEPGVILVMVVREALQLVHLVLAAAAVAAAVVIVQIVLVLLAVVVLVF